MNTTERRKRINELLTWRLLSSRSDTSIPVSLTDIASELVKDEDVPCIDPEYIDMLDIPYLRIRNMRGDADTDAMIPIHRLNRRVCEFSTQYVQFVGSILLHTSENIIMLRLNRDNPHVDGYKVNTVTIPEGHASWNIGPFSADANVEYFTPQDIINVIMRYCAFREFEEEITLRSDIDYAAICDSERSSLARRFRDYIEKSLCTDFDPSKVRLVYSPDAGSSVKHLLVCWDIRVNSPFWGDLIDKHHILESGEPGKHEVLYINKHTLPDYIDHYDLYAKEILADAAEDWLWDFMGHTLPRQ